MFRIPSSALALTLTMAALAVPPGVQAQSEPAASAPRATKSDRSNKAGKPPVEAAASSADVATKKPAKSGAQAGPASAPKP